MVDIQTWFSIQQLYADYAAAVDSGHWDSWPDFFTEPIVRKVEEGRIHCEANYAVFRTKYDKQSTAFNVGRYIDTIVQTPAGLKFAERLCIYDSEMIPNSIIYPI